MINFFFSLQSDSFELIPFTLQIILPYVAELHPVLVQSTAVCVDILN